MNQNLTQFKPFVFTSIRNEGFVSFEECFEAWTEKALDDDEQNKIDLMSVFDISWEQIKRPPPMLKNEDGRKWKGQNKLYNRTDLAISNNEYLEQKIKNDTKERAEWEKESWDE